MSRSSDGKACINQMVHVMNGFVTWLIGLERIKRYKIQIFKKLGEFNMGRKSVRNFIDIPRRLMKYKSLFKKCVGLNSKHDQIIVNILNLSSWNNMAEHETRHAHISLCYWNSLFFSFCFNINNVDWSENPVNIIIIIIKI